MPRTQNSQEFREQSVEFLKSGLALVEAARRLSLPKDAGFMLTGKTSLVVVGKHQKPLTGLELELYGAKRELAEVKMERDFITKVCDLFREGVAVKYGMTGIGALSKIQNTTSSKIEDDRIYRDLLLPAEKTGKIVLSIVSRIYTAILCKSTCCLITWNPYLTAHLMIENRQLEKHNYCFIACCERFIRKQKNKKA